MTKWARMRKRKERKRTEAFGSRNNGKETKLTQPEKISERILHSQEIEKPEQRIRLMNSVNPKYVLRNYLAEVAIRKAEDLNQYDEIIRNFYGGTKGLVNTLNKHSYIFTYIFFTTLKFKKKKN